MTRLPGRSYTGPDPAGFMSAAEVAGYLTGYARSSDAPVRTGADVRSVRPSDAGYRVTTTAGEWSAAAVVLATGWADRPHVPALAAGLHPALEQVTAATYRSAERLPDGGVLVVGASASGVQLADEIAGTGRPVFLAVGAHTRLPRRYRGLDILWWLDAMRLLERRLPVRLAPRPVAASSLQLTGRSGSRDVDLRSLQDRGVTLLGRVTGAQGHRLRLADDLVETTATADARLVRLLRRIDDYAHVVGLDDEILPPAPVVPVRAAADRPRELVLARAGIRSVVWATGYRRAYPWLQVPVLDAAGEIRHVAGTTAAPGLHVVGMSEQTRRNSTFIDGVRHDAAAVVTRILGDLRAAPASRAPELAA
jgi:putative flavoprotein involved in K+ transport